MACAFVGNAKDYYRRTVTVPFLDTLISHMGERFGPFQQLVVKGHRLVPAVLATSDVVPDMSELFDKYSSDLPGPESVPAELHVWWCRWCEAQKKREILPTTLETALAAAYPMLFPNIHTMLKILATIPVTSVECERNISALGLLKTALRSTMQQKRPNGLAMMHVHYSRDVDVDAIINEFAMLHPPRMALVSILSSASED